MTDESQQGSIKNQFSESQLNKIERDSKEFPLSPDFKQQNLINIPMEQLLRTKCTYFVKHEEAEFRQLMIPAFSCLLGPNLNVLDLTGFMTYCREENKYCVFQEAISNISNFARNIKHVYILSEVNDENYKCIQFTVDLTVLAALEKLQHLRELQIELFTFNLGDLMVLCSNVPSLQHLNVNLTFKRLPSAEKLRTSFARLVVFKFDFMVDHSFENFTRMCLENLPNLQVIRDYANKSISTGYKIDYSSLPPPSGSSNLRHLSIDQYLRWKSCFPLECPFVTHLLIDWEECGTVDSYGEMLQFSNIESLALYNVPVDILYHFLDAYKDNLLDLYVEAKSTACSMPKLSYNFILNLCPKLERICLFSDEEDCGSSPEKILSFASISVLKIKCVFLNSNIILAPELKRLELICNEYSTEFVKILICSIMSNRNALEKLEHMTIDMCWYRTEDVTHATFHDLACLIKIANEFLPKLTGIQLKVNYSCSYLKLTNTLKDSRTTDEEIRQILFEKATVESLRWIVDDKLMNILEECSE